MRRHAQLSIELFAAAVTAAAAAAAVRSLALSAASAAAAAGQRQPWDNVKPEQARGGMDGRRGGVGGDKGWRRARPRAAGPRPRGNGARWVSLRSMSLRETITCRNLPASEDPLSGVCGRLRPPTTSGGARPQAGGRPTSWARSDHFHSQGPRDGGCNSCGGEAVTADGTAGGPDDAARYSPLGRESGGGWGPPPPPLAAAHHNPVMHCCLSRGGCAPSPPWVEAAAAVGVGGVGE